MAKKRSRRNRGAGKVLIPIIPGCEPQPLLAYADRLRGQRTLLVRGVIPVGEPSSLSQAAPQAKALRTILRSAFANTQARVRAKILVSYRPEDEIAAEVAEEGIELVILPWLGHGVPQQTHIEAMLSQLPCDVAMVTGDPPTHGERVLVVLGGGKDSELALRLVLRLETAGDHQITILRIGNLEESPDQVEALEQVLEHLPHVNYSVLYSDDPTGAILTEAGKFHTVVLACAVGRTTQLNGLSRSLLEQTDVNVLAARSRPSEPLERLSSLETISILVDKWFAENTFYADEFQNLKELLSRKEQTGLTISLAMPTLNEEETIGHVIQTIQRALVQEVPLLDELVVIDSNSTDHTREIAESLGVSVYVHLDILPEYGARSGKGEALWKSLYVTQGDLLLWVDTDIVNIHPRFVYGLIGPLLQRRDLMFIKGFYLRPIRVGKSIQAGGGGRVTELTARPLLNLFFPALSGLIQPLSGEYGGRREALETLPFSSGYGVEIGLLIDTLEQFGLSAIGQVDLVKRIHRSQPLSALSMMSFAVIQTLTRKLDRRYGLELLRDINRSMKIIQRSSSRFFLEVEEIAERERPPMIEIPEYMERLYTT
ncbi:MAG: glucosyl-3-phosphoglycerate synthase [Anaerolineales bacterium]